MESSENLSQKLGRRVAQQRATLGLSLEEIAGRTGVSRAMVSRIERGEVHASAVVLDRLCAGLGISLSSLFAGEGDSPLARRAEQPVWQDPVSRYVRREVAPSGTGSRVKIVEVDFPDGARVAFTRSSHRVIEQHVWVLEGEVEVTLGAATYNLAAGDCLYMRLAEGNAFRNASGKPARYAVILTLEAAA